MINFYKNRFIYYIVSGIIILAGIIGLFVNGVELDIEFKGGSIVKYAINAKVDEPAEGEEAVARKTVDLNTEEADRIITEAMERNTSCQILTDNMTEQSYLVISFSGQEGLTSEKQIQLGEVLKTEFADVEFKLYETTIVDPFIGAKFLKDGITAVIFAGIMIILYVWYAFRKIGGLSAGVMALIALLHDCVVVFFAFVLFRIPLDENFIAAVLTIIGFSVNDTIVIYDRIRENMRAFPKMAIDELVNKSINQSLTRSINTSLAVFASILIVCIFAYIYNLSSITSFALPMTFGVISGSYSTICLCGPLWISWKKRKQKA